MRAASYVLMRRAMQKTRAYRINDNGGPGVLRPDEIATPPGQPRLWFWMQPDSESLSQLARHELEGGWRSTSAEMVDVARVPAAIECIRKGLALAKSASATVLTKMTTWHSTAPRSIQRIRPACAGSATPATWWRTIRSFPPMHTHATTENMLCGRGLDRSARLLRRHRADDGRRRILIECVSRAQDGKVSSTFLADLADEAATILLLAADLTV